GGGLAGWVAGRPAGGAACPLGAGPARLVRGLPAWSAACPPGARPARLVRGLPAAPPTHGSAGRLAQPGGRRAGDGLRSPAWRSRPGRRTTRGGRPGFVCTLIGGVTWAGYGR